MKTNFLVKAIAGDKYIESVLKEISNTDLSKLMTLPNHHTHMTLSSGNIKNFDKTTKQDFVRDFKSKFIDDILPFQSNILMQAVRISLWENPRGGDHNVIFLEFKTLGNKFQSILNSEDIHEYLTYKSKELLGEKFTPSIYSGENYISHITIGKVSQNNIESVKQLLADKGAEILDQIVSNTRLFSVFDLQVEFIPSSSFINGANKTSEILYNTTFPKADFKIENFKILDEEEIVSFSYNNSKNLLAILEDLNITYIIDQGKIFTSPDIIKLNGYIEGINFSKTEFDKYIGWQQPENYDLCKVVSIDQEDNKHSENVCIEPQDPYAGVDPI